MATTTFLEDRHALRARIAERENVLRSIAALLAAIGAGAFSEPEIRDICRGAADRVRDRLDPRRGMAEGRR